MKDVEVGDLRASTLNGSLLLVIGKRPAGARPFERCELTLLVIDSKGSLLRADGETFKAADSWVHSYTEPIA